MLHLLQVNLTIGLPNERKRLKVSAIAAELNSWSNNLTKQPDLQSHLRFKFQVMSNAFSLVYASMVLVRFS